MGDCSGSCCLNGLLWALIFFIIAWPVGFICGFLYVLLIPFEACIPKCSDITKFFLRGARWPLAIAKNMIEGRSLGC